MLFFAKTGRGVCIRAGTDIDEVEQKLLREVGTRDGVQDIRIATESDIAHVRGMGGRVPQDVSAGCPDQKGSDGLTRN